MANIKISELEISTELKDENIFPIVESDQTKIATIKSLKDYFSKELLPSMSTGVITGSGDLFSIGNNNIVIPYNMRIIDSNGELTVNKPGIIFSFFQSSYSALANRFLKINNSYHKDLNYRVIPISTTGNNSAALYSSYGTIPSNNSTSIQVLWSDGYTSIFNIILGE